jgi:RNA polymerase sigma-70 factor (ECF subfamily)
MNKSSVPQEDQVLIDQTLDGNTAAFGGLVRKYQNRLYNGMVNMLRNEAEAEDVVQDAFILALTKLSSFHGNSAFFTWLYRIAYNVAVSRIRRRKPTVSLNMGSDDSRPMEFEGDAPAPDERIRRIEDVEQLHQALDNLSDEHRDVLVLREMQELDYEAISEILDLPIGTVRSRIHRARSQLKHQLEILMAEKKRSPQN